MIPAQVIRDRQERKFLDAWQSKLEEINTLIEAVEDSYQRSVTVSVSEKSVMSGTLQYLSQQIRKEDYKVALGSKLDPRTLSYPLTISW